MDRLHALDIGLLQSNPQVVRLVRVPLGTVIQLHPLPLVVRKGGFEKELYFSTLALTDSVCLVKLDALFEKRVDLRAPLLL